MSTESRENNAVSDSKIDAYLAALKESIEKLFKRAAPGSGPTSKVKVQDVKEALEKAKDEQDINEKDEFELHTLFNYLLRYDKDGDGTITFKDFISATKELINTGMQDPRLVLDTNTKLEFENASLLHKVTKFPGITSDYVSYWFYNQVSRNGELWWRKIKYQLQTLLFVYISTLFTKEHLVVALPLCTFYISIFSMLLLTMEVLHDHELCRKFQTIEKLYLIAKNPSLSNNRIFSMNAEGEFEWHTARPYFQFFISSLFGIMSYFLTDKQLILSPFLAVLALICCVVCLRANSGLFGSNEMQFDVILGFIVVVRFIGLYTNSLEPYNFTVPVGNEFDVSFNIIVAIEAVGILSLLLIASASSMRHQFGIGLALVPMIMVLIWSQFGIVFASSTSLVSLILSFVIICTMFISIPLSLVLSLYLHYYCPDSLTSLTTLLMTDTIFQIVVTFFIICVGIKLSGVGINSLHVINSVMVLILFLIASKQLYPHYEAAISDVDDKIPFDDYCLKCGNNARVLNDRFDMQIRCADFVARNVYWNGHVVSTEMTSIDNTAFNIIKEFPLPVQVVLKCILGQSNAEFITALRKDLCHLSKYNVYNTEVMVSSMCKHSTENETIILRGRNSVLKTVLRLRRGDKISFTGTLQAGLGTNKIIISVSRIEASNLKIESGSNNTISSKLQSALHDSLRTVLGPIGFVKIRKRNG